MATVEVVSAESAFSEETHVDNSLKPEEKSTEEVTVIAVKVSDVADADAKEEEAKKTNYEDGVDDTDVTTKAEVAEDVKVVTEKPEIGNCTSQEDCAKGTIKPEDAEEVTTDKTKDDRVEEDKAAENSEIEQATKEGVAEENNKGAEAEDEENPVIKNEESAEAEDSNEKTEDKIGEETAAEEGDENADK